MRTPLLRVGQTGKGKISGELSTRLLGARGKFLESRSRTPPDPENRSTVRMRDWTGSLFPGSRFNVLGFRGSEVLRCRAPRNREPTTWNRGTPEPRNRRTWNREPGTREPQ